jgi:lipid II:glycine glycyltransferase (peptidoglycan interpeptide bridge formation enzyme)
MLRGELFMMNKMHEKDDLPYSVEVDNITQNEWSQLLLKFEDANIFQTWEYGSAHWGDKNISHLVLRKEGQVVAAAQLWVVRIPVIGSGFAHISWGPMWRLRGKSIEPETARHMLRSLREEYVVRRRLLLRIRAYSVDSTTEGEIVRSNLESEGFQFQKKEMRYHTYRLNLSPELQEIRRKLLPRWRKDLNKAERLDLTVIAGDSNEMFQSLSMLYHDMVSRKGFKEYVADMSKYANMQKSLPEKLKLKIFLCYYQGEVVAGRTVALLGDTSMAILAATSTKSIELNLHAAYLLQWKTIEWLKQNGFRYFDLRGGVDGDMPGVKSFKRGLSGDEIFYLGSYENHHSKMSYFVVRTGEFLQDLNKIKNRLFSKLLMRYKNELNPT